MDKILAPFEELLNENSPTVDKLDECFDNNCVNGVFLCYACIIEYLDNDKEDFAFYIKQMKSEGICLDEFYKYRNTDEKESLRQKFRAAFMSVVQKPDMKFCKFVEK